MDPKERLTYLVNVEDISAIQILAGEIGRSEEETKQLLEEILRDGNIDGYITEDGRRIFKKQVEISDKPTIKSEEKPPDFLSYNTTPGRILALIGLIVVIAGGVILATSGGVIYNENLGLILIGAGALVLMFGGYWIGRLKTP